MKRVMIALGVTGAMFLAVTPTSCQGQMFNLVAALCPDCYAHFKATHPAQ